MLLKCFASVASRYSHVHLILVGIGSQEQQLRAQAQSLGITNLVRFIIGQDAYAYYPLFDCFVLTSDQEGISMALLEAMCFRLPCIVTNIKEQHSVLDSEKNGFIVPARNTDQLLNAFSRIIEDEKLARRLGRAARNTVQQYFNAKNMVQTYGNLFKKICKT